MMNYESKTISTYICTAWIKYIETYYENDQKEENVGERERGINIYIYIDYWL